MAGRFDDLLVHVKLVDYSSAICCRESHAGSGRRRSRPSEAADGEAERDGPTEDGEGGDAEIGRSETGDSQVRRNKSGGGETGCEEWRQEQWQETGDPREDVR